MVCDGKISATVYEIYVPISMEKFKQNIILASNSLSDLKDVDYYNFTYNKQALTDIDPVRYKNVSNDV